MGEKGCGGHLDWGFVWGYIPVNTHGAQCNPRCIPVNTQRDQWECGCIPDRACERTECLVRLEMDQESIGIVLVYVGVWKGCRQTWLRIRSFTCHIQYSIFHIPYSIFYILNSVYYMSIQNPINNTIGEFTTDVLNLGNQLYIFKCWIRT